jgi:outer membrane protein assembly factor BamB
MRRKFLLYAVMSALVSSLFILPAYSQLANSPWPMFHQNLRHTGLSLYAGPSIPFLSWSYQTGGHIYYSPVIGSNGKVYVGSADNYLYSINSNGSLDWHHPPGRISSSAAIGSDGKVYVGSSDNNFYSVNPDATLVWSYRTDSFSNSPAIGSDGKVYVGSANNYLFSINSNGSLAWSYNTGGSIYGGGCSSPAVGSDGKVYVGSKDTYLYSLNSNGSLDWRYQTGPYGINYSSPAIGSDGKVYVGSADHYLYSINSDGGLSWSYQAGGYIDSSPAIGVDEKVYFGSDDTYLYSINSDGSLNWRYRTWVNIIEASPTIGSDGKVYIGSYDNNFYSINSNGSLDWTYLTGADILSSPAIDADGKLYVGSCDNCLYSIQQQPTATPTATVTPTQTPQVSGYIFEGVPPYSAQPGIGQVIVTLFDAVTENPVDFAVSGAGTGYYSFTTAPSTFLVGIGTDANQTALAGLVCTNPKPPALDLPPPSIPVWAGGPNGIGLRYIDPPFDFGFLTPTPTITPTPTPTWNPAIPTPTPIPPLAIDPGPLTAGQPFTFGIALTQAITQPFDFYILAETPAGVYTIYMNGKIKKGITPIYKNVPKFSAGFSKTVSPSVRIPLSMKGKTVTFYSVFVQAGKNPPVRRLSALTPTTQYVILMAKNAAVVN